MIQKTKEYFQIDMLYNNRKSKSFMMIISYFIKFRMLLYYLKKSELEII